MASPKLACCNFIPKVSELREYSLDYGFSGIDWTFTPEDVPSSDVEETDLMRNLLSLRPLEIRYHLFFVEKEIGRKDFAQATMERGLFFRACRVISRLGGKYVTIHVGLDRRQSANEISWQKTISSLKNLVDFARSLGLRVCLENLPWGWTSRPDLFEKIIRKASCWGTLDIGHARASQSVASGLYDLEDFAYPHPERILNAHVYHEETSSGHIAPASVRDIESRLKMLTQLPFCDWWVLELREHKPLVKTLRVVREFLMERRGQVSVSEGLGFTRSLSA
ncbi:MAG: sugar phosphate isomerase/epimerase [Syntrophaceae bacterium]|nr:sugar phosphate isomerase/epimerase [Syntrophaceae bacterium]